MDANDFAAALDAEIQLMRKVTDDIRRDSHGTYETFARAYGYDSRDTIDGEVVEVVDQLDVKQITEK